MISVGSNEAKTRLPALLEWVVQGERIIITKRGKPVAMLVPPPANRSLFTFRVAGDN